MMMGSTYYNNRRIKLNFYVNYAHIIHINFLGHQFLSIVVDKRESFKYTIKSIKKEAVIV